MLTKAFSDHSSLSPKNGEKKTMPHIIESDERLERHRTQIEKLFEEKVMDPLNKGLSKKGYETVKYLGGILNEQSSKIIYALFEETRRNGNFRMTASALGESVVAMRGT